MIAPVEVQYKANPQSNASIRASMKVSKNVYTIKVFLDRGGASCTIGSISIKPGVSLDKQGEKDKSGDAGLRKIVLCIAVSLDGFIADKDGGVDFVFERPTSEPDLLYRQFYDSIDLILYGSATYRQMKFDMGFERWPYPDKMNVVFSSRLSLDEDYLTSTALTPLEFIQKEKTKEGGDIWLFGGRRLIRSFMADNLIDRFFIYICPTILGAGVPLFDGGFPKTDLRLVAIDKTADRAKIIYDRIVG